MQTHNEEEELIDLSKTLSMKMAAGSYTIDYF